MKKETLDGINYMYMGLPILGRIEFARYWVAIAPTILSASYPDGLGEPILSSERRTRTQMQTLLTSVR